MKIALFLLGVFIFFFSFFQTPQPSRTRCVQSYEESAPAAVTVSCDSVLMVARER